MKMLSSSFDRNVVEPSTASSFSTWRNIVQRCVCASKIPMAIAITAASSRANLSSMPTQPLQQKKSSINLVSLLPGRLVFLSHCVESIYIGDPLLGKLCFTSPLVSNSSVKKTRKKKTLKITIQVCSLDVPR